MAPVETDNWVSKTQSIANDIRVRVIELTLQNDGCYLSQALSSADILATLYDKTMRLEPLDAPLDAPKFVGVPGAKGGSSPSGGRFHGKQTSESDRFLISPAHYAVAIYAALEAVGRLREGELKTFNQDGSTLEMIGAEHSPGFELTTGSFGQALSQSAGIAFSRKLRGDTGRTFVFVSDGELEEGQTWEGVQASAMYGLDNLYMLVDVNGQQVDGLTKDIMNIEPIDARFEAFGWNVARVDGHDIAAIDRAIEELGAQSGPSVILCDTNSAQGISYLDKYKPNLHYVRPKSSEDSEALRQAIKDLKKVTN